MEKKPLYLPYSQYLKEKYGEKVYKLPINLPVTCPNRDGSLGKGGCIFCGEMGAGHEALSNLLSVEEQLAMNMATIRRKYKARKFIAYFQNFSNTYLAFSDFCQAIRSACQKDIVEIAIATRPDCIGEEYLDFLKEIRNQGWEITIELGLQTVNYHTLQRINRGHGLAEFIDAVLAVHRAGFEVCAHMILNLPWDDHLDVVEGAKIISALRVEQVKLHALNIIKGTALAELYLQGHIELQSVEEYMERVILFLEYLDPRIAVQRLIGRAPEKDTLVANWDTSWWKIRDDIERIMEERGTYQGKAWGYLGGRALKFLK